MGQRLHEEFGWAITDRRVNCFADVLEEIERHKPTHIVNCIGHTGKHNVDDCEIDKDRTLQANTFVPIIMADAAYRTKVKLVHISSGCIYHFDYGKQKPITEEEEPDFFDLYYSRTKIYTEQALNIMARKSNILIARIRIPLDNRPHPKNILDKLIKYGKVIDCPNSVTYVPDFCEMLNHLIKIDGRGIFNTVNKFGLYYPQLMDTYKKYVPDFRYEVMDYRALPLVRTNLVMSVKKLEKTGFTVRRIQDVLDECVRGYLKQRG
jgi:dTDP-4-dehydrorhamnose reductase